MDVLVHVDWGKGTCSFNIDSSKVKPILLDALELLSVESQSEPMAG